jgi:hypothetical protein
MDERDRRYEERFIGSEKMTAMAQALSKEAISKAEIATEKRFDAVNEMRGSLNDMTSQLMTKAEAVAKFSSLEGKNEEMKKDINSLRESRSGGQAVSAQKQFDIKTILSLFALFGSFVGIIVAVAAILLRK